MGLFSRRVPAEARALIGRDERIVAWALGDDDRVVVATNRGLWWPADPPRRIGWELIDKAVWYEGTLSVTEADLVDDLLLVDRRPAAVRLEDPRDIPKVVRRRVENSVVNSREAAVSGGRVRLVGRRVPGRDGVSWWARLEPGTPDTDEVRAQIRALIAQLTASASV